MLPPRSNISPQVGVGFNRDYWARFEKMVKDVAKRRCVRALNACLSVM